MAGSTYELPLPICGKLYFDMANICRMLLRNVLSTLSRSISAKFLHIICFDALFTRMSTRPNFFTCWSTASLQVLLSIRFPGMSRHVRPSASTACLVALASVSSSGRYTIVTSAPSRAYRIATDRPIPELSTPVNHMINSTEQVSEMLTLHQ